MSFFHLILEVAILIMSTVIHEYAHGWAAFQLGDATARDQGRLTANPLRHLDPFGSLFLPLLLLLSGSSFLLGYAKPVPFNPYNLRDQKYGAAKVAIAGPLANFAVAIFFGLLLRILPYLNFIKLNEDFVTGMMTIVYLNILLGVFNLIPLPPLDGSKVIAPFLPYSWQLRLAALENMGFILVLLFVFVGWSFIYPVIYFLFQLLTGLS